jgi:hypothetical protein
MLAADLLRLSLHMQFAYQDQFYLCFCSPKIVEKSVLCENTVINRDSEIYT